MKYATLDKQGKFTGVLYDELTENVKNFHIENGLTYIKVNRDRLEPINEVQDSEDEFSFVEPDYGYPTEDELDADAYEKAKQAKSEALATIVVTTSNGHSFDGNFEARLNMTNAIISADVVGQTSTNWKLADNTTEVITLQELKEALALATLEVGRIVGAVE